MVLLIIIPMKNGYFIGNIPYFQTNPIFHHFEDYLTSAEVRLHLWKLGREAEMWRQIYKDHATLWIDWPPRFSGHREVNGERIGWFCKHVRNCTGEFLVWWIFRAIHQINQSVSCFHVFSVLSIATFPPKETISASLDQDTSMPLYIYNVYIYIYI